MHKSIMKSLRLPVALFALAASPMVQAVQFSGAETAPGVWTYDLTYNPLDNYSIYTPETTITITGLFGVTGATAPTSTTFADPGLSGINLAWTPEVLDGGTTVKWTHVGPGTGNFDTDMFVYGFKVFAANAVSGVATLQTNGFSTDTTHGVLDRDVTLRVMGPVPEPETYAMFLAGLGLLGAIARRHRKN